MNQIKYSLLLCFLLSFYFGSSKGVVRGGEVTYRYTGVNTYEVTFVFYRDCLDTVLQIDANAAEIVTFPGTQFDSEPLDLQLVSISRLPLLCGKDTITCTPSNTANTGKGIEKHVYRTIVCLDSSPYKRFAAYNMVEFSIRLGRSNDYTNVTSSVYYYNSAVLNLKEAARNSSPQFSIDPVVFLPCFQPVYLNWGVNDLTDGDSLSFHLGPPRADFDIVMGYDFGFSTTKPLTVYDPLKNGKVDPTANPPIGFYFNPMTGDYIFTPTDCAEKTISTVYIAEWRKDGNGEWVMIGTVSRDIAFITESSPENVAPEIIGPFDYQVCEGDKICFDIKTDDKTIIPPPPRPAPDDDTVSITWNNGIPGATFTIIDPKALHQTGRFCWTTPSSGASRILPYIFTVTARDNFCPRNMVTVRSIQVYVDQNLTVALGKDTLIPKGSLLILDAGPYGRNFLWSTGETTQTIAVDTFGKYWVEVTNACNSSSDTIEVRELIGVHDPDPMVFRLYPNPASRQFKIEPRATIQGTISVTISDAQGRIVVRDQPVEPEYGIYKITPNVELKPGTYIVQVKSREGYSSGQLLLIK